MFSEKLKSLRKQAKMSQEQLAENLNVSRQAITKWETGVGIPDIENLRSVSSLFHVSIDELLDNGVGKKPAKDFLYESITEYDIDGLKSYDITLAGASRVLLAGYEGEKIQVRLASDLIPDIQSSFKVKIDDVKRKIDIDVRRFGEMTETTAKELLSIFILFPVRYVKKIELSGNTETLELEDLDAENIEFTGKASRFIMGGVSAHVEIDCSQDMDILCSSLNGRLDVNQISATSKIRLPSGIPFIAVTRGINNAILYESDGITAEDFSLKGEAADACENIIELNGMKSELIINAVSSVEKEKP